MKAKKKLLIGTAIAALAAGGASAVSTMAWFNAVNTAGISGTAAIEELTVTDPVYEIGSTANLQVTITEYRDEDTQATRGTLYLSAIKSGDLVTAYLDSNSKPVEYTPSGTKNTNYCFAKLYKIEVKSPATIISGADAVALRNMHVYLSVARKTVSSHDSTALFAMGSNYDSLTEVSATNTSVGPVDVYTFGASIDSVAANTAITTQWLYVRLDGGTLSRDSSLEETDSPQYANFEVSVSHTNS